MKNQITLTNETLYTLRNLIADIDYEESHYEDGECDSDLVIESLYKIKEVIASALL